MKRGRSRSKSQPDHDGPRVDRVMQRLLFVLYYFIVRVINNYYYYNMRVNWFSTNFIVQIHARRTTVKLFWKLNPPNFVLCKTDTCKVQQPQWMFYNENIIYWRAPPFRLKNFQHYRICRTRHLESRNNVRTSARNIIYIPSENAKQSGCTI